MTRNNWLWFWAGELAGATAAGAAWWVCEQIGVDFGGLGFLFAAVIPAVMWVYSIAEARRDAEGGR